MKKIYKILVGLSVISICLVGCASMNSSDITKPSGNTSNSSTESAEDSNESKHIHNWGSPTYTWSEDYLTCTAERVCLTDNNHKEIETANSTYKVVTEEKCETNGKGMYTVSFKNSAFTNQIQEVVLPAAGHNWGSPTYTWSEDYLTCTAERVCLTDNNHKEIEIVETDPVLIPATFDNEITTYEYFANFKNSGFETQKKKKTMPYLGEYPVFNNDNTKVKYGLYPQTNIDDESLVSTLNQLSSTESNGMYLYNEEYYATAVYNGDNTAASYKFDNGIQIIKGTKYWFKCKPIVWNVLSNKDDEYFLLSNLLLDSHCYYFEAYGTETSDIIVATAPREIEGKTIYSNNYKYSDIRTWLNNIFYDSAFALNNEFIKTTLVDNSSNTTNTIDNPFCCDNTYDNVFLPSVQDYFNNQYGFDEFTNGFYDTSESRCCKTTDWARVIGIGIGRNSIFGLADYWTRSPSYRDNNTKGDEVYAIGKLGSLAVPPPYYKYGVRPAITIQIPQE